MVERVVLVVLVVLVVQVQLLVEPAWARRRAAQPPARAHRRARRAVGDEADR